MTSKQRQIQQLIAHSTGRAEDVLSGHMLRAAIEIVFQPAQEREGQDALTEGEKQVYADALTIARWYATASPEDKARISEVADSARRDTEARIRIQMERFK